MAGPGDIARSAPNKLVPNFHRVIYMDAGCWQSRENGMPHMTFGLMEHNAIALCAYFSPGKQISLPVIPKIKYDFYKSNICKFLSLMMRNRYNVTPSPRDPIYGFHILKIFPFPENSLLNDVEELRIFVPDLHLHFFKDTLLDNFITKYGNSWSGNRIVPVKLPKRISMETDFAEFLQTVSEYQKQINSKTRVHFLGDMFELWETEAVAKNFVSKGQTKKYYEGLDALVEWLWESVKNANSDTPGAYTLKKALKKIVNRKLTSLPLDPLIENQVAEFHRNPSTRNLLIDPGYSKDKIIEKARAMSHQILLKHHGADGSDFSALLDQISWKYYIHGNHDNYLFGIAEANNTFGFGGVEIKAHRFRADLTFDNAELMFNHGHNMDDYNNDDACAIGRLITCLLTFYELKSQGDVIKDLEAAFRSEKQVREDLVKKIARIGYTWEEDDMKSRKRNKIIVLAHTHLPAMEDITNEFLIWKGAANAWPAKARDAWTAKRTF